MGDRKMQKGYRSRCLAIGVSLAAGLFLTACSGDTDGGAATDVNVNENQFVGADSGRVSISLNSQDVNVGETTGFFATVTDANGAPVQQIPVACDSERGLAIIEPNTGQELTDSRGAMSGTIGCEVPGSFQFACRASNRREFVDVVCRGTIPAGFGGFGDTAGGTLGTGTGGVATPENGDPGGTDIAEGVRISAVQINDVQENVTTCDTFFNSDCNGDGTTDDPEPFVENIVCATFTNDTSEEVTVSNMQFTVPQAAGSGTSGYTSPNITQSVRIDSNGGTGQACAIFTTFASAGGKTFAGRDTGPIPAMLRNITFRWTLRDESGDTVTLSDSIAVNFQAIDNCTG